MGAILELSEVGEMRILAFLTARAVIDQILDHLRRAGRAPRCRYRRPGAVSPACHPLPFRTPSGGGRFKFLAFMGLFNAGCPRNKVTTQGSSESF